MIQGRGHKPRLFLFMPRKSIAISNELARITPNAEPVVEVLPPGPNPPAADDIKRLMLNKITTNAERMIDSLILLGSNGHFQSAHYLLEQMSKLGVELKTDGGKSIHEILSKIARQLAEERAIEHSVDEQSASDSQPHNQELRAEFSDSREAPDTPAISAPPL
jgi:hypothetical protein